MPQLHRHAFNAHQSSCNNVIKDKTCQLSNSLWTGNQPELPSGQLISLFQDPTNCSFDHFCAIFQLMTSPGIHVNNVPIVADSMHIEVGVGFPCLDCAFLTSRKAERLFMMHQCMTDDPLLLWRHLNLTETIGSSRAQLYLVSDWLRYFAAIMDWIHRFQA